MIIQQLINGIALGGVYALFAASLTLVFGVFGILNLAHGAVFTWGSLFGLYLARDAGLPFALALVGAMLGAGLLSVLINRVIFEPLAARRRADVLAFVLASLGLSQILERAAQLATDTKVERYPTGALPENSVHALGVRIAASDLLMFAAALVLMALLFIYLYRTDAGVRARATAESRDVSRLVGIKPARVSSEVFFVSGATAGAAGVLIGAAFNSVQFLMGSPYLLVGIVVIVAGGLGSVQGALIAGVALGIVYALSIGYLPAGWYDVIIWSLLLVVVLVRPSGLFRQVGAEVRAVRR